MTNSIVHSNFVRFDADGLELVVETSTGKAYASISATARMLETPETTVRDALKNTSRNFPSIMAEIQTGTGLKTSRLFASETIFELAFKYHPGLAFKMGAAGANVYMLALAGYQTKIVEAPQIPQSYAAALMEAGRLAMELEAASAKIEADAPLVEYAEAVQHSDTSIEFNEFAKMIGTGRTRLFRAMRDAGVIMKNSTLPYQKWCDAGYFEVSQEITDNGKLIPFALVTGKGQIWLTQRLVSKHQFEQKLIGAISNGVKQMSILGES
jgi:phage antirepressor YoqD-like protein